MQIPAWGIIEHSPKKRLTLGKAEALAEKITAILRKELV
jgi:hypothetical protein